MLDVEQILSNVDLGAEAPSADAATEQTETVTTEPNATEHDPSDGGQVTESVDESQGTEQTQEETPASPAKGVGTVGGSNDKTAKDTVPLALHLDTKHKLRELKVQLATLQAHQAVAAAKPAVAIPEKSPMEKFIETEGGDATPTAKVLMSQRQWEQAQGQQQATTQASDAASRSVAVALQAMTDETVGEGLGFETVLLVGNTFLTEGDKLDVRNAGDKAGEVLYQRCLERAIRSGTPQGKLLAAAVRQVRASVVVSTVPKTPKQPQKKTEVPTREQVLQPDITGAGESLGEFFGI